LNGVIGGDIGCSSLAPFRADWLMCMNAGIGVSQGMAQVLTDQPVISTGGDGSFFHAGALSLMSAVHNDINLIHMVFDNSTIAMTGHQPSPSEFDFDHHKFLEGMGVKTVIDVSPYDPKDFIQKFKDELPKKGVRVFWVKGACVLKGNDFIESRRNVIYPTIDATKCGSCSKCYKELACPAIINLKSSPDQELAIDLDRCVRCGVCNEICPNGAISIQDMI
jgi:indolepyruvate ferredoxin oxidoreductase alpha subunit